MNSDHLDKDLADGPELEIKIRVTAQDSNDPAAVLHAIQNALAANGVAAEVTAAPAKAAAPVVKDESLETSMRRLAQAVLEEKTRAAAKDTARHDRDAARATEEIVALRKGGREYVLYWSGQGVRIFVEVIEKTIVPLADAVNKIVTGLTGGKKDG